MHQFFSFSSSTHPWFHVAQGEGGCHVSFQIPRTVRPSPWEAHARDVADGSWEATRTRTKKAKSCSRAPGNTPRRRWSGFVRGRRSEPMHRRRPRWNWKPCDRLGRKHERSEKRKDGRFDGAALGVPARVGLVDETHVVETNGTWFFCGAADGRTWWHPQRYVHLHRERDEGTSHVRLG